MCGEVIFVLLFFDLDDYAPARAPVLSDDDMILLKTLRFYRDQKNMQDPAPKDDGEGCKSYAEIYGF